jgi:AbiV family abortive infection protein
MSENVLHIRNLCLDQAESFIAAAEKLSDGDWAHIVYHLSLLALEEVGKASMISARMIDHSSLDGTWLERSLDNHRRKLLWAVWSPMRRIDPADFEAARQFADRAHARRLASLYADPHADPTDAPPNDEVQHEDADQALALARARLNLERSRGVPTGEVDDITRWFLDGLDDANLRQILFSKSFIARYEEMGGDVRSWAAWAKEEIGRVDDENRKLLAAELAAPGTSHGQAKPRWRASTTVYTPSHSLRPKVLARWNEQFESVQLIWTGKKDQFKLQIVLHDNEPLPALAGRLAFLSKLTVACLNIGSIGYFWFGRPGFERDLFKDVHDLKLNRPMGISSKETFWGDNRAVALTEEHIDHAIRCMMAYLPLPEAEAEPIFAPYLHGLAFIAKSDVFYSFDELARQSFATSLASTLRKYGGWSGKPEEFEETFHAAFEPFMQERDHRDQLFQALTQRGDANESPLANLRTAKHLADLYLIYTARENWRTILQNASTQV